MPDTLRIGVLFGGQSGEHEVSLVSAASIMDALDTKKYTIIPIGISKHGHWVVHDPLQRLRNNADIPASEVYVSPDPGVRSLIPTATASDGELIPLDVLFPVIHGTTGEDGRLQGLFDLAQIPYVGSGVLGSAIAMDKVIQKQVCQQFDIPVVRYAWIMHYQYAISPQRFHQRCAEIGFPLFVKPANLGSSVGISKVHNQEELPAALDQAFHYDNKVIVEQGIEPVHEIEIAALGNETPRLSVPGEIIPSNEFYDYDAKYIDGASRDQIPATLPTAVRQQIQGYARQAFVACQCNGLARIDFLVHRDTHAVYLNEINTMPGFTSISMYSKLWEASGMAYPRVLDTLIALAQQRHNTTVHQQRTYQPKRNWHQDHAQ